MAARWVLAPTATGASSPPEHPKQRARTVGRISGTMGKYNLDVDRPALAYTVQPASDGGGVIVKSDASGVTLSVQRAVVQYINLQTTGHK